MRGYFDIGRADTLCVHFVYSSEYDRDSDDLLRNFVGNSSNRSAYFDGNEISSSMQDMCNLIGHGLNTDHYPYQRGAWGPLLDDLAAFSYRFSGLLIVIANADSLLLKRQRELFKFIEIFQLQHRHWIEQKKPCDVYLQIEPVDGLRELFAMPFVPDYGKSGAG